jgi:hypothetical protein
MRNQDQVFFKNLNLNLNNFVISKIWCNFPKLVEFRLENPQKESQKSQKIWSKKRIFLSIVGIFESIVGTHFGFNHLQSNSFQNEYLLINHF